MSTQINVTVEDGGLRDLLKETVAQNRERRQEQLLEVKTGDRATSELQAQIADAAGISLAAAAEFLANATAAEIQQALDSLSSGNFDALAEETRGSGAPTFYRKPETSAQKDDGYPIPGCFITSVFPNETTRYLKLWSLDGTTSVIVDGPFPVPISTPSTLDPYEGQITSSGFGILDSAGGASEQFLVFPISASSVLVAYCTSANGYTIQYASTSTRTWENVATTYQTKTASGQATGQTVSGWELHEQIQFEYGTPFGVAESSSRVQKCFIVGKSQVKEVTPPTSFITKAAEFIYDFAAETYTPVILSPSPLVLNLSSLVTNYTVPKGKIAIDYFNYFNTFGIPISSASNGTVTTVWRWDRADTFINFSETQGGYVDSTSAPEPRYWDSNESISFKTLGILQGLSTTTPGAYYYLQNTAIPVEPNTPGAQIAQQIFPGIAPSKSLAERLVGSAPGANFVNVYYDEILDNIYWYNEITDPVQLAALQRRKNNKSRIINPPNQEMVAQPGSGLVFYSAWDWGNPAYCLEQLLSLGFSKEDLAL